MPLGNALYTYETIKNGYTTIYQMIGAILCFVSIVLVITAFWMALFLIKSDMDEDIRNIGIYKSLGMTGMQIMNGYLICYGIIGLIRAALGSIAGGRLSKRMITGILADIGIYKASFTSIIGYQFMVLGIILAAILLLCFCAILRIYRVNASYAN